MKLIIAIIKPFKLEEVREALNAIGVGGISVTEVKGFGQQKSRSELYRETEYVSEFLPKAEIQIIVSEDMLQHALEVIQKSAHTGKVGDGKLFVRNLEKVVRIRTGETGADAI
jgi:nitrogen regulatory protein P-II 2